MADKYSDKDYLFLTAMLRARQAAMLTEEQMEQMIASGSFSAAAGVLSEIGWPDMSGMDSQGVNTALAARRDGLLNELARLTPQSETVNIFRIRYDYHNAKSLIKGEAVGAEIGHLLSAAGRVSAEELTKAFQKDDYRAVPDKLGAAMREAKAVLARTANPQLADFILDRACYAEMTATAAALGNDYATGYIRRQIDVANLRTAVRCARVGRGGDFMENALIPDGTVSPERILAAGAGAEGIVSVFTDSAFKKAAALGGEVLKGGRLTAFELECDNVLARYVRDAKMHGFGPEAVIGYLGAEENNITAARMILTGLIAGMDPERLKERLRETYV